MLLEASSSIAP